LPINHKLENFSSLKENIAIKSNNFIIKASNQGFTLQDINLQNYHEKVILLAIAILALSPNL
jgi:hypothetical protein